MAGKIWRYDCYDLRKFKPMDINCFIDIGANIGSTSLMVKILNPIARIIALEPCKKTFEYLESSFKNWRRIGVEKYNIAIGDGNKMYFYERGGECGGMNKFYSEEEKEKGWGSKNTYGVDSKTLKQIFNDYKIDIDQSYIIKIDCEGGERFLLQSEFEEDSLMYIRNSVQTMIEVHFGLGGTKEQWNSFITKLKDTHELRIGGWKDKNTEYRRYEYNYHEEIPYDRGHVQIELVNKKWIVKGY